MPTIDWSYLRKNCESCDKARHYLAGHQVQSADEVDCKKTPWGVEELRALLPELSAVLVTRGRKLLELDPVKDQERILEVAIGRSGNLRAPALRHQGLLVIGFEPEAYRRLHGESK